MLVKTCKMPDISDIQPSAIGRFLAASLIGIYQAKGKEAELRFAILARLIDKARHEYSYAREAVLAEEAESAMSFEEIRSRGQGQFLYGATITNHLENCVNALGRIYVTLETESSKSPTSHTVKNMRDMVEHMDEKIRQGVYGPIALDISEDASIIKIFFRDRNNTREEVLSLNTIDLAQEIRRLYTDILNRL